MRPPWIRSFPYRSILALAAAVLVRCTPDVAQCIALPGSSIYVTPPMTAPSPHGAVHATLAVALQGRAALLALAAQLRGLAPTAFP
jgi:hypothetical protein